MLTSDSNAEWPRQRVVPDMCAPPRHRSALMAADARLRSSALLALTKLMAVDAAFCEANLRLVFTLLHTKCVTHVEPA